MVGEEYKKVQTVGVRSVVADLVSSALTAFAVSPIVCVIDKTIIDYTKHNISSIGFGLKQGFRKLLFTPHKFFRFGPADTDYARPFLLVYMVYGGTYTAGNITQSYCEAHGYDIKLPKFVMGSIANIGLTLVKDTILLRLTDRSAKPLPVPRITKMLFVVRDSLTVAAAFSIPPIIRDWLVAKYPEKFTFKRATDIGLLICPVMVQYISTPIHLSAIHLQGQPHASPNQILTAIGPKYLSSTLARQGRILPAFGAGGMINVRVRNNILTGAWF